ncbi:hypothetical protein [Allonocardiopsis opalescens]|nr:hypothetical protein [Allonocardiopsis opalescens]
MADRNDRADEEHPAPGTGDAPAVAGGERPGGQEPAGSAPADRPAEPPRTGPEPGPSGEAAHGRGGDLVDGAARFISTVQRRAVSQGIRYTASAAGRATGLRRSEDVWQRAVREPHDGSEPSVRALLDQIAGTVRHRAPEVFGHLGRAGGTVFNALRETVDAVEDYERRLRARREAELREEDRRELDSAPAARAGIRDAGAGEAPAPARPAGEPAGDPWSASVAEPAAAPPPRPAREQQDGGDPWATAISERDDAP